MQILKILAILFLFPKTLLAKFDVNKAGGRQVVRFTNVGPSNQEVCVLPQHFEGSAYQQTMQEGGSVLQVDETKESELCSLDFHSEVFPSGVCPKMNSTNPGLEIFKIPNGLSKTQMEKQNCKAVDSVKMAKYKLSTSCSYTPSILGYYHVSRMLGDILHIPVSVLRTVDQSYHLNLARKGLKLTPARELIHQTFQTLVAGLSGRGSSKFNDRALTTTGQSFGAISEVVKGESNYEEFYHVGKDDALAFKQKDRVFKMLSTDQPATKIVGQSLTKENLQKLVAMKDISEMLVIDYLMSQQDRFRNIASINFVYFKDDEGLLRRTALSNVSPDFLKTGVFVVKEMVLKDNDCGLAERENLAKTRGLTMNLRHMHPTTYHRLLWLNSIANAVQTKEFLSKETLFTSQDQSLFRANLSELAAKLKSLCAQGKLHLDLDFNQHFTGKEDPMSKKCDLN